MIALSMTAAAMLYLGLTLALLLGIWGTHHFKRRRSKLETASQELRICEYCNCAYLEDLTKAVTQCPQCSCYNKNNPFSS